MVKHTFKRLSDVTLRELYEHFCETNPKTGCWLWRRSPDAKSLNTPRLMIRGVTYNVPKLVWRLYFHEPPPKYVGRSCGNTLCVCPSHFKRLDTDAELMAHVNTYAKRHAGSQLKVPKYIREFICTRYAAGASGRKIATEIADRAGLHMSYMTVLRIAKAAGVAKGDGVIWSQAIMSFVHECVQQDVPRRKIVQLLQTQFNATMKLSTLKYLIVKHKMRRKPI